jgi:hypothetical protein
VGVVKTGKGIFDGTPYQGRIPTDGGYSIYDIIPNKG